MTCKCGYADECDGSTAIFYPLQDGGMCSVRDCQDKSKEYDWSIPYKYTLVKDEWGTEYK